MRFPGKLILLIFLIILRISSQGQGLIAHYNFDDNVLDISGNNNNGVIYGGVQVAADRFRNPCGALQFNGVDGYIEVPDSRTLKSPENKFSATCWFKIQSTSANYKWLTLICKGGELKETPENPQYRVQVFQSFSQSTISINTEFTEYDNNFNSHLFQNDEWHHYAMVYDGENVLTYLDGIEIWKFPYKNPLVINDAPLHIGMDIPGAIEHFSGCMDDLRIFNTALDAKQINKIYRDDSYAVFDHDFNLICPDNINVNTDKNRCFATVMFDQPVLDIKCGTANVKQISGQWSGSEFPLGNSTLVFEAKSNYGVQKSCYMKVIVTDIEPPVFNPLRDTTLWIENDLKGKAYYYSLPGAKDNCNYTVKLKSGMPSGTLFPEGQSILTFIATDLAGNQTEALYAINVKKKDKSGTSKCPEDILRANNYRQCGAIVSYSVPDSVNKNALRLLEGKTSGSFYKVGDTKNRYSNSGSNECSFTITVYDDEKPEMKCQNDTTVYIGSTNQREARVFYKKPQAFDNCKIDTIMQVKGYKSGEFFPTGVTQNIFIAKDIYGNSVQCSFNITVVDSSTKRFKQVKEEEPVITATNLTDSIKYYKTPVVFDKCIITLSIYDDSKQDGDTVSLFFNGNEIIHKKLITIKKNGTIDVALILEPGVNNYFIFKAWNEGSISPNTLRIEFYEGYFLDNMKKMKRKKPAQTIIMHAKVGVASAISLKCKN